MMLRIPSSEFEPHSTPPGPVIISTRLTTSIGWTRPTAATLMNGSNIDTPSWRNCTAWICPRDSTPSNVEWNALLRCQPGTVSIS
jgi:hypothetical protein